MSNDFAGDLKYRQLLVFLRNLLYEMETDTEKIIYLWNLTVSDR